MMNTYHPREMIALPTGKKLNPAKPEDGYFYDPQLTLHVIDMGDGKLRSFTTWGSLMAIGQTEEFKHDQTGRWLGMGTCVSTLHPDGTLEGAPLPNRNLPHWVAK